MKTATVAINNITQEIRKGEVSLRALEKASDTGIDKCTGSCKCDVEPDGTCPQGWPSRCMAAGVI